VSLPQKAWPLLLRDSCIDYVAWVNWPRDGRGAHKNMDNIIHLEYRFQETGGWFAVRLIRRMVRSAPNKEDGSQCA